LFKHVRVHGKDYVCVFGDFSVSDEGTRSFNQAITLGRAARKQWVEDLLPREELVSFAYAYPLEYMREMGHIWIGETASFYFRGESNTCPINVQL